MRGDVNSKFYSPLPNPLQQEREQNRVVTQSIQVTKSCIDTYSEGVVCLIKLSALGCAVGYLS